MRTVEPSPDGKTLRIALTSRSPNFHIAQGGINDTNLGQAAYAEVRPKANFLQVARYKNRLILKNGYHRTYQLMAAGESHVPAVVCDVQTWEDTGDAKDGFFSEGQVISDRLPTLPDYLSDAAVTLESPATNTVIEVIAQKKQVPR